MKIGVQTFWTSNSNYGQLFQGYALQNFLIRSGCDAKIIRFDSVLSKIKEIIILLVHGKYAQNVRHGSLRGFAEFRKKYIRYSEKKYRTYKSLTLSPPPYDCYVVGSDQVWAYMRNKERRNAYLLNFGGSNIKKIAYAASFGRDGLHDDEIEEFKNSLINFSFLGVREKTGKDICESLGLTASWVTDPVTLLSAEEWRSLEANIPALSSEYKKVFLYTLANEKENANLRSIKEELKRNYKVYYTNSSEKSDESCQLYPTPQEWLAYIDGCDLVITDSFHCTMFCIIFKQLVIIELMYIN